MTKNLKIEEKKLRKPIKFNMWDEPRCPHCDIELHYRVAHEVVNEKQKLLCQCGGIITPQKYAKKTKQKR